MFVSTPGNQVLAINARTGTLFGATVASSNPVMLHPTSRGVAVCSNKGMLAAGEAVLVALNAQTGRGLDDSGRQRQRDTCRLPLMQMAKYDRNIGRQAASAVSWLLLNAETGRDCGGPPWFPRPASRK